MSYTDFEFVDMEVKHHTEVDICVSITIKNAGNTVGSEVVQLYVAFPETNINQPISQLRGFCKIHDIHPGETKKALIELDKYAFSFWDPSMHIWRVIKGKYKLNVGKNSSDVALQRSLEIENEFTWSGL